MEKKDYASYRQHSFLCTVTERHQQKAGQLQQETSMWSEVEISS